LVAAGPFLTLLKDSTTMQRLLLLGMTLSLLITSQAVAGPPSYLLLKRASTPHALHAGEPNGVGYAAPAQGYAYGWFGVCPRVHPERQMGSYRANIDWRFK
jgi:hypothetical protein